MTLNWAHLTHMTCPWKMPLPTHTNEEASKLEPSISLWQITNLFKNICITIAHPDSRVENLCAKTGCPFTSTSLPSPFPALSFPSLTSPAFPSSSECPTPKCSCGYVWSSAVTVRSQAKPDRQMFYYYYYYYLHLYKMYKHWHSGTCTMKKSSMTKCKNWVQKN